MTNKNSVSCIFKKTKKLLIVVSIIFSAFAFTIIKPVNWKVKDNYCVKWETTVFKGLKATILFDEENPGKSIITASIDARTVNSGDATKDMHIKEKLAADKYPMITFVSTAIKKTAIGYEATGNLTLKGITKEIKFSFFFDSRKMSDRFPFVDKETFSGKMLIASKDFKIDGQGEIVIDLAIPVTQ